MVEYAVYVLRLVQDKYYVGMTPRWRLDTREEEHMSGHGSKWTRRFPPLGLIKVWFFPDKKYPSC